MAESVQYLHPDILCLQETKADHSVMEELVRDKFPQYQLYNSSALKKGYSGVATLVRESAMPDVFGHSSAISGKGTAEGRPALFSNEGRYSILRTSLFTLVNVYIPSGTSGESRQKLKYDYLDSLYLFLKKELDKQLPVIVCGDFNICHREIDIHHPKIAEQRKLTGFLPEERLWMDKFIELGFTDCFRHYAGDRKKVYSWWSYRARSRQKNLGWRIDYIFCSGNLRSSLVSADIHTEIEGSDHCPVVADFNVTI